MALIFNLSSQPANQFNKLSEGVTKVIVDTVERVAPSTDFDLSRGNHIVRKNAHFFAYLVLALLVMNAVRRTGGNDIKLALLICVLYAISDETHQIFVPGRSAQLSDVLIYLFCFRVKTPTSTSGNFQSGGVESPSDSPMFSVAGRVH